ncbi:hypothetical protein BC831DRAFT_461312 [Entophlyctis helioformis]|nr:hypothetical protein BC831DRAFT_461312 [Entophlyctis helioformis]
MLTPSMCMDHISAVLQDMALARHAPTVAEWRLIVWAYIKSGAADEIDIVLQQSQNWCRLFDATYANAASLEKAGSMAKYAHELSVVSETDRKLPRSMTRLFHILRQALVSLGNMHGLQRLAAVVLERAEAQQGGKLDVDTYELLIELFRDLGRADKSCAVLYAMRHAHVKPTEECFVAALQAIASHASRTLDGRPASVSAHLDAGFADKAFPSIPIQSALAAAQTVYRWIPDERRTAAVYAAMLAVTEATPCSMLVDDLWMAMTSAGTFSRLSDASPGSAARHVSLLPQHIYWSAIKSYLRANSDRQAHDILKQMLARRDLVPDPRLSSLHSRFLRLCFESRRLGLAKTHLRLVDEMQIQLETDVWQTVLDRLDCPRLRSSAARHLGVSLPSSSASDPPCGMADDFARLSMTGAT